MKLYAPKYYKRFKCIAGKCEHSCCIGWEIDIDEDTAKKYKKLKSGYGSVISDSVSNEGTPHFKLGEHDRCPHLDENGLCRIILNLGEDYLCDICREHPRFYNYTSVAEVGIGMSCPEAARVILSAPDYAESEAIGETDADADVIDFDGRAERGEIYAILGDSAQPYADRLDMIYRKYEIDTGNDARWREIIRSLEYLDEEHRTLFLNYSSEVRASGQDEYLERFLAYLIYRHCTEAFDDTDFRERLSFCLFCERLLSSLICLERAGGLREIAVLASIISEELEYSEDNTFALTFDY